MSVPAATAALPRLLTEREVAAALRISRVSLWKWRRAGRFPAPIVLGPRTLRWPESAVANFLESRKTEGR